MRALNIIPIIACLFLIGCGYHKEECEIIKRCVNGHHYEIYRNGKNSVIIEKHNKKESECTMSDTCLKKNG